MRVLKAQNTRYPTHAGGDQISIVQKLSMHTKVYDIVDEYAKTLGYTRVT